MKTSKLIRKEAVLSSSLLLMVITFMTKVVALLRDIVLASRFGATQTTDAYFIALTIPNVLLFLLGIDLIKGTSTSIFSAYLAKGKYREMWQVFSSIFNITFLMAAGVILLGIWQMPRVISWIAPTFGPEQKQTTVTLGRILLTLLLTMGLSNYLSATLNSMKRFFVPALATFTANAIVLFFWPVYPTGWVFTVSPGVTL